MMRGLLSVAACLVLALLSAGSTGQVLVPGAVGQSMERGEADFSYCRFDSTELALCREFLSLPVMQMVSNPQLEPRMVPLYVTMESAVFRFPGDTVRCKILYGSDGVAFASLAVLAPLADGKYGVLWESQDVPPAGGVRVQLRDITSDGRPDIIATARGGNPVYEAMMAYDFDGQSGRLLAPRSGGFTDPRGLLGIGVGIVDSLGRDGYPAIEVWQDDPSHPSDRFVRIRNQYSDSAKLFLPAQIDTLNALPRWCRSRRRG